MKLNMNRIRIKIFSYEWECLKIWVILTPRKVIEYWVTSCIIQGCWWIPAFIFRKVVIRPLVRGGAACRYLVTTSDYSTPADARLIGPLPHKYHDFHSSPKRVPLPASDSKDKRRCSPSPHDPSITPSHPPPGIASDMEAGSFELVKYWMTRATLTVFKKIRQNDMEQKLFFLNTIHLFVSVTARSGINISKFRPFTVINHGWRYQDTEMAAWGHETAEPGIRCSDAAFNCCSRRSCSELTNTSPVFTRARPRRRASHHAVRGCDLMV